MWKFYTLAGLTGLVFSASVLAGIPALAGTAAALTKQRISSEIIGKTLDAKRMGLSVRILYKADGEVTMKFPFGSGAGTWSYSDNGICMLLASGPRKGKTCVTFEHLGGNKYRNSEGIVFTVAKISKPKKKVRIRWLSAREKPLKNAKQRLSMRPCGWRGRSVLTA